MSDPSTYDSNLVAKTTMKIHLDLEFWIFDVEFDPTYNSYLYRFDLTRGDFRFSTFHLFQFFDSRSVPSSPRRMKKPIYGSLIKKNWL